MQWTNEQLQAINEKGTNILVAAAAGSGKTAVLVERIVNKIINEKIDIDKILVVTFTNLAASQMKERILDAIYKIMEENPENMHLQRQITLLPKSNICTIDSFCLDVVKNHFYELDISPNFRIANDIELKILKQEVLEELFEEKYENQDEDFIKLIETYTSYRGDENLKDIILKIYNYMQSTPYPKEWLSEQVKKFELVENPDFSLTEWGQILFDNAKETISDGIVQIEQLLEIAQNEYLSKTTVVLSEDIRKLKRLDDTKSWEELYNSLQEFFFDRWATDKNATDELNSKLKRKRDLIKKNIEAIKKEIVIYNSETALEDIRNMYYIMKLTEGIIDQFSDLFMDKKKEKNIVDFSDIEHFALEILIKNYEPTEIAKKYQEKFDEIAIDEYQDSNLVQELILNTISRGNNVFMVGDVKQSIYKFRQARPELFLEKYDTYKLKESKKEEDNLKIKLFKNFRSRKEIIDITNIMFQNVMSKEFGAIEYNEEEYLNLGAEDYKDAKEMIPELHIIDVNEEKEIEDENSEHIENVVIEAKFVANKIREMVENKFLVSGKDKNLRPVTYKDFVILLRSTKNIANIYEKELSILNIPVFCDATSEYLTSYEIQIIMSLLKIIDNPQSDIPQITILRSMIGGFDENELLEIRRNEKTKSFYNSMLEYCIYDKAREELKVKVCNYIDKISKWREDSKYLPLDEFIWKLYLETGFYNYVSLMQNGEYRIANLKMLFEKAKTYEKTSFKGLFNFINFIDKLQITSGDMSGAKIIGENENVVRIMSIHKSKGLEFPVVFLSSTGKKFNMIDINQDDILLHNELGLGPKFIDNKMNIKFDTLARKTIAIKTRQELIDEELRILYVALTRAKEKIIITGIEKDLQKQLKDKQMLIKSYEHYRGDKINKNVLKKYTRYLDYFELIILKNEDINRFLKLEKHKVNDVLKSLSAQDEHEIKNIDDILNNTIIKKEEIENIKNKICWNYNYIASTKIMSMASVSEIKEENQEKNLIENEIIFDEPKFLKEELEVTGARRGTITHLILQNLDEKEEYTIEKLKELINTFVTKQIITDKEAKSINVGKIYKFTKSIVFEELKKSKMIYREKPFYMYIPASLVDESAGDENVLIQGIIDLYYINKNDELILLDYKTDYVEDNNEEALINKYKIQLELYKMAIEQALNRNVDKICIYSTYLEKVLYII